MGRGAHFFVCGGSIWQSSHPSVPSSLLSKVVGPWGLCRVWNEGFVSQTLGSRAGVAMIMVHQLFLQSKIRSLPLLLTPLPYPSHNAPICPSHVIFVFLSAILFAQCFGCFFFFSHMLVFLAASQWLKCLVLSILLKRFLVLQLLWKNVSA